MELCIRSSEWRGRCAAVLLTVIHGLTGCSLFRPIPESIPTHHARASTDVFVAGAAAVDITPAHDVWLGGYGALRTSDGVHDPLYARALVLKRGDIEMAIVAVDVVGIQRQDILRIQKRFDGIDPRHVLIVSTHNHSGPDTLGLWGFPPFVSGVDNDYREKMESGILEALHQAQANVRPAAVGYGSVIVDPRGLVTNLRRPGVVDREVVVLHVREADTQATIATLTELGCHPEVLGHWNKQITADFPHWTIKQLEHELGGTAIYVSGALGGMAVPDLERTEPPDEEKEWQEAERIGLLLAKHSSHVVRSIRQYDATPDIALWHAPLFIPNRNFGYELVRWTGVLHRDRYRWGYFLTEVNLWQIGTFRLATVPGEITPALGLRIKRNAVGEPTMLVGLANDEIGYLLPSVDYDLPMYEYERTLCPGYDAADRIVQRLEDLSLLAGTE